jgi:hypothetical protein
VPARITCTILLTITVAISASAQTPVGTQFTYQGQLLLQGGPLNDTADLEFTLWDAGEAGNQIGSVVAENEAQVVDGLFTVDLDFGNDAFNGDARWLEIAVRSPAGSGTFTTLSPRQPLTAAPYALKVSGVDGHSLDSTDGSIADAVFVNNAGRVGIGTSTPAVAIANSRLEVIGGHVAVENNFGVLSIANSGSGIGAGFDTTPDDQLSLFASGAERVRITTGGNVGIGTNSPQDRLHVNGNIRVANDGSLLGSNGLSLSGDTAGGPDLHVAPSGDVGIGTSTPLDRLHVNGNILVANDAALLGSNGLVISGDSVYGPDLYVATGGNVGIGTFDPDASLEVAGGVRARGGAPGPFGDNNNGYSFSGEGGDNDSGVFSLANGEVSIFINNAEHFRFSSSGLEFNDGSTINRNQFVASRAGVAIDFGLISGSGRASANGTLMGAQPGDVIVVSVDGDVPLSFILFGAHCPAPNQYRFQFQNIGTSAADPPAFTFSVVAIRP